MAEMIKEIAHNLLSTSDLLKVANDNLSALAKASEEVADRIKKIEKDLHEKEIRKKTLLSLVKFYPVLLFMLLSASIIGYERISDFTHKIKGMMP